MFCLLSGSRTIFASNVKNVHEFIFNMQSCRFYNFETHSHQQSQTDRARSVSVCQGHFIVSQCWLTKIVTPGNFWSKIIVLFEKFPGISFMQINYAQPSFIRIDSFLWKKMFTCIWSLKDSALNSHLLCRSTLNCTYKHFVRSQLISHPTWDNLIQTRLFKFISVPPLALSLQNLLRDYGKDCMFVCLLHLTLTLTL